MKADPDKPPKGSVRDWLDDRASSAEPAFIFTEDDSTLTWRVLRREARRVAQMLTGQGVAKSESVAILHPNGREGIIALYGALYGGFRATMINLVAGPEAIAFALDHAQASVAFVHEQAAQMFEATKPHHMRRLDLYDIAPQAPLHPVSATDDALLMYTSGTTGQPKGVVHSHASLLAGGWTAMIAHDLTPQDRGLCVLPIYHINGLCVSVMGGLVSGGAIAIAPRFSAGAFWCDAARTQVTWFSVVPTIISHLLHGSTVPDLQNAERIRFGRSASSALAPDVQRAFEARFAIPIIETMGLTETAAQILSNPLPPGRRKVGSPGIAFGNEVAILDPTLQPCAPGTEGEIAVRGPNVMRGYFRNRQATQDTFAGDWLRTGDLGRMDAGGYVFVTGRLKELIIKGGENIAPREIDEALHAHADVVEAAAFGRPCAIYGERVEAAVCLRDGATVTAQDLRALCEARLGQFKSPDRVHVLDGLPKGPSGKIQRRRLADICPAV